MKTIYNLLIVIIFSALALSCEDFLIDAATPLDKPGGSSFFDTEQKVQAGIIGIYEELYTMGSAERYFLYFENRSDNASQNQNDVDNVSSFNLVATSSTGDIWKMNYTIISRTNILIQDIIDNFGDLSDQPEIARYLGEARFMRAFAYFNLVVIYGGVPLITEQIFDRTEAVKVQRTDVSTIFNELIIPDLEYAADNCFTRSALGNKKYGHVTKGAAKVLLAEAYLNLKKYAEAESIAEEVIASGEYALLGKFSDLYGAGADNNKESIWEIQFDFEANGVSNRWIRLMPFELQNASLFKQPQIISVPSVNLINAMIGDPRYVTTLDSGLYALPPNETTFVNARFWKKYHDFNAVGSTLDNDWNIKIFRLADAYHLAAEAEIQQGKVNEGFDHLNVLRQRVGLPNYSADDIPPGKTAIDLYLHERRMEFAGEMKRWRDLKRTGKAIEILEAYRSELAAILGNPPVTIPETKLLYPIPQAEIDANPLITQNPGY